MMCPTLSALGRGGDVEMTGSQVSGAVAVTPPTKPPLRPISAHAHSHGYSHGRRYPCASEVAPSTSTSSATHRPSLPRVTSAAEASGLIGAEVRPPAAQGQRSTEGLGGGARGQSPSVADSPGSTSQRCVEEIRIEGGYGLLAKCELLDGRMGDLKRDVASLQEGLETAKQEALASVDRTVECHLQELKDFLTGELAGNLTEMVRGVRDDIAKLTAGVLQETSHQEAGNGGIREQVDESAGQVMGSISQLESQILRLSSAVAELSSAEKLREADLRPALDALSRTGLGPSSAQLNSSLAAATLEIKGSVMDAIAGMDVQLDFDGLRQEVGKIRAVHALDAAELRAEIRESKLDVMEKIQVIDSHRASLQRVLDALADPRPACAADLRARLAELHQELLAFRGSFRKELQEELAEQKEQRLCAAPTQESRSAHSAAFGPALGEPHHMHMPREEQAVPRASRCGDHSNQTHAGGRSEPFSSTCCSAQENAEPDAATANSGGSWEHPTAIALVAAAPSVLMAPSLT